MSTQTQPENQLSPAVIFDTLNAYQRTAALRAAIELDLFGGLAEAGSDAGSLARHCAASERGVRILCDYLTVIGLLAKEDGLYRHSPASAAFLDPRSPACLASTAHFLSHPVLTGVFSDLSAIVRRGSTSLPGQGSVEPEHPMWVDFARSMAPMMAPLAGPLADLALEGLTGPLRVLDIAAGHGLFGLAVAAKHASTEIVAQDWGAVLEVAVGKARKAGLEDRFKRLPGNAFDVDFGGPFDIALLTNFLHHYDAPTCVALLKKVRACMTPAGRAVALEFVPNDDRVSPPTAAAFSLMMLGSTPAGDAYTARELEAMYREAGFARVAVHPLPPSPETAVIGYVA